MQFFNCSCLDDRKQFKDKIRSDFSYLIPFIEYYESNYLVCYQIDKIAILVTDDTYKLFNMLNIIKETNVCDYFSLNDKKIYLLTISVSLYYNTIKFDINNYLYCSFRDDIINTYGRNTTIRTFILENSLYDIYGFMNNKNKYPATLKHLCSLNKHFAYTYLSFLNSNVAKDILYDLKNANEEDFISYYMKIEIKLLENTPNKQELLKLKYPNKNIPKVVNKIDLAKSKALFNLEKYLSATHYKRVWHNVLKLNYDDYGNYSKERILSNYMFKFNDFKIDLNYSLDDFRILLSDYIKLSISLKRPINLDITSVKRLKSLHDDLVVEYDYKIAKKNKMVIKKDNPFLKLKLPDNFKMIKTNFDLIQEGRRNKNCVASYIDKINSEKCGIFTLDYKYKHYTIEIIKYRNKYYINQIKTFANEEASKEVVEYVKAYLN
ncbi:MULTISPECIES: PcfJ domain-containing protein [unclassified Campylobacter]|uniref:PcfJ domain-containing protein n=1 Tax=unclassified Campylobacter TaxID=2593542 RepID=UPI001D27F182|nr:PcfJ domain-containing protein [Campylobacter sp. RM12651]MBZ7978526.1 PcfJ domain-containing protein [Campylobacter sp. RM12654]MBZ7980443.1 PcfJ domain-containing protein [Campylobacter sp. RM12642]MBZ7990602.1 PcfJ domain-containing protein [Campylobacter sp. RM9331]MBZ8004759.1 PcfJ domain-containing protein [Campylobacter sp. RM9332]ULO04431.1 hypothetical protein AVBRAN_2003 [Campylobacter sp. RM12651]